MASWPSNTRHTQRYAAEQANTISQLAYPVATEGSLSSAILYKKDDRFYWTTITGDNGRRLRCRGGIQIFPRTHSYNKLEFPTKSIIKQSEASAKFLRRVYPDIEVSSALIKDEITLDAQVLQNRYSFDPFVGNLLETVYCDEGSRKPNIFLAFPIGESSHQLNISPCVYSRHSGIVFKPSTKPILLFPTPIQQIILSKSTMQSTQSNAVLAVRTMGSASLLTIQASVDADNKSQPRATQISQILPSEVGGRPLVDMHVSHSSSEALMLVLNDQGSLYECSTGQGSRTVQSRLVYPDVPTNDIVDSDSFRKLAVTDDSSFCCLVSNNVVRRFDLRAHACMSDLWATNAPDTIITSVETPKFDHLMRLVTTKEVLWLDERFLGKPLLGVPHRRDFDRTLKIFTASLSSVPLSFLTSTRSGLVSVYDVSSNQDGSVHVHTPPYCIPLAVSNADLPLTGCTLLRHQLMHESDIDIFQLSSGGIYQSKTRLSTELEGDDWSQSQKVSFQWSDDTKELQLQAKSPSADLGPLAEREYTDVDLRSAYEGCFINISEAKECNKDDALHDILDNPFFSQDLDVQNFHVLTTCDVIFRSDEVPAEASRAKFLSDCGINGKRLSDALRRGGLSANSISNHSAWHQDLTRILRTFVPDISENIQDIVHRVKSYNLSVQSDRIQQSSQYEISACDRLALDLYLSTHVYSSKAIPEPARGSLEDAFETMSLAASHSSKEQPPPVQFSVLTPILTSAVDHYPHIDKEGVAPQKELTPLGVRLLLSEWILGTDPSDYIYEDPYKDNVPTTFSERGRQFSRSSIVPMAAASSQTQKPPLVVAASAMVPPQIIMTKKFKGSEAQSQDVISGLEEGVGTGELEYSQDPIMVNTQPVSGPFGGRQISTKRKGGKNRIGGF